MNSIRHTQISHASSQINYSFPFQDLKLRRILLMEFLGTVLFGLSLHCATNDMMIQTTILFCNEFLYFSQKAILFSCKHSGAQYHIGVTLILMFRPHRPIGIRRGILQILIGILGFFCGALISSIYLGKLDSPRLQSYEKSWIIADLCGEILATTSFMFINVLQFESTTQPFKQPLNNVIFLVFGILYSRKLSPHSGGCMNPTIAIAFNLAVALVEQRTDLLINDLWLFIVGPLIGTLIIFILYYYFIQPNAQLCKKFKSLGQN